MEYVSPEGGKMLVHFFKDKYGQRRGTLVAFKHNRIIHIGWARFNKNKDIFDKHLGVKIATIRALEDKNREFPFDIENEIINFTNRARRYFK